MKKYFLFSSFNLIPALIMGGGFNLDTLILAGVAIVMSLNFLSIVKIVRLLNNSTVENNNAGSPLGKVMVLFGLKFILLAFAFGGVYALNKNLIMAAMMMVIFQLIILILSIKNNYLK